MSPATPHALALNCLWIADAKADDKDRYVAFRGEFETSDEGALEFLLLGATWFVGWIDGRYCCEGPARFPKAFPEYQTFTEKLPRGRHVLAIVVNHVGVSTRMLEGIDPFLACMVRTANQEIPARWKCASLTGFAPAVRRINPQLGFIEWCDTRQIPDWIATNFNDRAWSEPVSVSRGLGPVRALSSANAKALSQSLTPIAAGEFIETFGYERDDIPARFFLRDLGQTSLPPQGVWRRYDLGRVRLMRPRFQLDLPSGTVVEFAYCEALVQGRVSPWITLSGGDSCNLDHFVARGGPQEFFPVTPRGGRYLEVHVFAPPARAQFLAETIVERAYYGSATGALQTDDPLLNRIWSTGVETHRACAEDAITDNPTRERGQWAGDVVTVGMDIAASVFADLRLCRRSLAQSAQCARADGLVSGLCPGGGGYLTTYAAQWINACVHYWELTGDRAHLDAMFPFAEKNLAAFANQTTADGVKDELGWGFVDWGYVRNPGASDMGVNLHYLAAIRGMVRWCEALGHRERAAHHRGTAATLAAIIARYYAGEFSAGGEAWNRIGYHRAALGLRLGFFDATQADAGRAFLREHMLRCFPNRADAPRLSDPAANNPQLITPYFGHFALPELIEHGDMDFVLGQYRTCWGWSLGTDRTTWLEVFDTRWSHSHQWAGCPTWQLSRYLLGLQPRHDLGAMNFNLALATGSLPRVSGSHPIPNSDQRVNVSWTKDAAALHYKIETPLPLTLHLSAKLAGASPRTINVDREFTATWPIDRCR